MTGRFMRAADALRSPDTTVEEMVDVDGLLLENRGLRIDLAAATESAGLAARRADLYAAAILEIGAAVDVNNAVGPQAMVNRVRAVLAGLDSEAPA